MSFFYFEEIDECEEQTADCAPNSKCVNVPGAYYCECEPGFYGHCDSCIGKNLDNRKIFRCLSLL